MKRKTIKAKEKHQGEKSKNKAAWGGGFLLKHSVNTATQLTGWRNKPAACHPQGRIPKSDHGAERDTSNHSNKLLLTVCKNGWDSSLISQTQSRVCKHWKPYFANVHVVTLVGILGLNKNYPVHLTIHAIHSISWVLLKRNNKSIKRHEK